MDIDPNDILSTNEFISKPLLNTRENVDKNKNFQKYYQQQSESRLQEKALDVLNHTYTSQENESLGLNNNVKYERTKRERKTFISVDSRDRDKNLYPKPSFFKIFLGKTYYNVKTIKLSSLEFPNTNAVISSRNDMIYWRNYEDIVQDNTVNIQNKIAYPTYSIKIRTGSYTASTLRNEMMESLQTVRRVQGLGDYHFFLVDLDIDTDVVTFTSLILTQLPNNPFSTTINSNVIIVNAPNHGYENNEYVYIYGPKQVAGISATTLTGFFQVTVLSVNVFTFEVKEKAAGTVAQGGGNTVKTGRKAPFQLLWGNNSNTVAQNIGYPIENSSSLICTYVSGLSNIIIMSISIDGNHDYDKTSVYIGNYINIGSMGLTWTTLVSYRIVNIINKTSVLVMIPDLAAYESLLNIALLDISFDNIIAYSVSKFSIYSTSNILITTEQPHNFTLTDINKEISLYDTVDPTVYNDYNYDGNYILTSVLSDTELLVPGFLPALNIHPNGLYGKIPRHDPIQTHTCIITDVFVFNSTQIVVITSTPHLLLTGDSVYFNNLNTTPKIKDVSYIVSDVIDDYQFIVDITISSVDYLTISEQKAIVGTGLITLSMPKHGFNTISDIQDFGGGIIFITTTVDHNLEDNSLIRLSEVNTVPSIDGAYTITVTSSDTFYIQIVGSISLPPTPYGVIGISNEFYLYDCEDVGGINKSLINNIPFTVREILDANSFRFMIKNTFAKTSMFGGGPNIYISSIHHGFNGIQTNTKNNVLHRSINLEGENYTFLTCPQLDTIVNTGNVKNIFARISLNQAPGYVCYDYLSNPKHFNDVPLSVLSELEFSVVNYDGEFYNFSDLDFSFTLEITEVIDESSAFNLSTKRGIIDTS